MRKILMVLAFAGMSVVSMAQETPVLKHSVATNSFWSNWFIQVGANWNAWYSQEEHGFDLKKSPFESFRSNPGVAVAVGKWFTPGLGLRLKAQGIWGKSVGPNPVSLKDIKNIKDVLAQDVSNKYWILNGHAMFNLSNMLCGYNENRVFNFIPFVGAGFGRSMTHNFYAMDLSAGLQAQFRINKNFAVHVEAGWNRLESDIDGGYDYYGNRGWDSHDNNVYAELGLTINLGKATWNKVPDVDAINADWQNRLDAINGQLRDANNENDRLRRMLAEKPEPTDKSVKEFITTPVSVFFDINKTEIAQLKDLVNVEALAKFAKDNNRRVHVTGYADSATGTPEINQRLSEGRATRVVGELVKMGVNRDKITSEAKGGVKILSPISYDRRATVQIVD
ncbi:MAG: OmpA family protein [Prevotellaceae bacterium]|nr:OmpA family protein [Prevotella sp.]MDD7530410.1 OmpA family protein [Prevotellaceae bacterium]MDY2633558.1 OmpA family protein [Prevotella sp.]